MPDSLFGLTLLRPWLLLLWLPAIWLVWRLYRNHRTGQQWQRLISPDLQPWLLQQPANSQRRGRYWLLGMGWSLAILVLSGPAWETQEHSLLNDRSSLVMVLDVSRQMLANDLPPNRLQLAQRKIHDISQRHADSQLALIAFAGSAHRVTPLTTDVQTLRAMVDSLHPDIMPRDGQRVDLALELARETLDQLPPDSSRLLLITAGLPAEQQRLLQQQASELGSRLVILGVGSADGAPLPLAEGGFMRDIDGSILLSRLDAPALASLARRHGAGYHGLTLDDSDIDYLLSDLFQSGERIRDQNRRLADQGHWLLLLLIPLAAVGARRGLLVLMLAVLWLPAPAAASWWQDLWLRPDQQAMQLLADEQPAAAAERFEHPGWRAWAWHADGDYARAAAAWARLIAESPDNPDYHFNHGTSLALAGRYTAALEAFEQALTRAPEHQAARHNRARVEAYLESLQQDDEDEPQAQQPEPAEADDTQLPPGDNDTEASEPPTATDSAPEQVADNPDGDAGTAASSDVETTAASTSADTADSLDSARPRTPPGRSLTREQEAQRRWLQEIEDNPGELLRRKFRHEYQLMQESP
ncbi:MAG: VWA domain-containing protein [Gammaproteobacteria bacterium]|nr:VWA domain-containing protein [Gammaproteobacteria bacterium]